MFHLHSCLQLFHFFAKAIYEIGSELVFHPVVLQIYTENFEKVEDFDKDTIEE